MATTSLPDLLAEILLGITSHLSYGSHLALRHTCHKLFAKIDDPNRPSKTCYSLSSSGPEKKAYSMADLLEIEQWPDYNAAKYMPLESKQPVDQKDFFACHLCLRLCSAGKFSNAMMKGKRGKLGTGAVAERSQRFCIPCGIAHGRYQRGTYLQFGGALGTYGFVCHKCGEFEQIPFCSEVQAAKRTCAACWNLGDRKYVLQDPFQISMDCSDWRDILL